MRFGVLGQVAAWTAAGEPVVIAERKVRTLLAALLVDPGSVVSADRLIDQIWGDDPPSKATNALQAKVSQLRRSLETAEAGGRELVVHQPPGYVLKVDGGAVDADRFTTSLAAARAATGALERERLTRQALDLWRGPAFADFADEQFCRAAITRHTEAKVVAMEERAAAQLELGQYRQLLVDLADLPERYPLREGVRSPQLQALYHSGRQNEALQAYARYQRQLATELGMDPSGELAALHRAMLRHELDGPVVESNRPGSNLPAPVTELIGRDDAVAEVSELLASRRLVTLTGPGGVGKTRLATEAAERVRDGFADGAWLVEFASLAPNDSADAQMELAETVMAVLRVGEHNTTGPLPQEAPAASIDRLIEVIRGRELLMVWDNCEHVVVAAATLAGRLLRTAPGLRILATSQQPLAATGETSWPVPPLTVPEPGAEVAPAAAVQLFVARAAAAAPGFALTADNAAAVGEICRRLDGIPLALELAAPRVRVLSAAQLLERLQDRFALLSAGNRDAPPRQQTLRSMIDWSYWLLGPRERAVLRRLAVTADGCTLDAAETICSGGDITPGRVLPTLTRLVDRSLVSVVGPPDAPRFRLLESVAEYARQQLQEGEEAGAAHRRHGDYYAGLAAAAQPHLHGRQQREWLQRLDIEAANLRRALELRDSDRTLRMVNALAWYWTLRGRFTEAERWIGAAIDAGGAGPELTRARTWLWGIQRLRSTTEDAPAIGHPPESELDGRMCWFLSYAQHVALETDVSSRSIQGALAKLRDEGDQWGIAAALSVRAAQSFAVGDIAEADSNARQSMAMFVRLADRWGQLQAIYTLANIAEALGDYAQAAELHSQGLAAARELGLWREVSDRLSGLGRVALLSGDFAESNRLHHQALRMASEHHYHGGEISAEIGLGLTARRSGDFATAEPYLRRVLSWGRQVEFAPITTLMFAELGYIAQRRGDAGAAVRLQSEGLRDARKLGDPRSIALALEGCASAAVLTGRAVTAARLLGTAQTLRESAGTPMPAAERTDVDTTAAAARAALGEAGFNAELADGASRDQNWFTPEPATQGG